MGAVFDARERLTQKRLSSRAAASIRNLFTGNPEIRDYLMGLYKQGLINKEGLKQLALFLASIQLPRISRETVEKVLSRDIGLEYSNILAKKMFPEISLLFRWVCKLIRHGYTRRRHRQLNLAAVKVLAMACEQNKSAA